MVVAVQQQTAVWNDAAEWLMLARGPFGELLPPDLCAGLEAEEITAALAEVGLTVADPVQGRVLLQQLYLRAAVAGQREYDDLACELRKAVIEQHVPLSLRPLGLEHLECVGFAPVVTYLGGVAWRVGLPHYGRIEFLVSDDPAQALAVAQQTFARWYQVGGGTLAELPWTELLAGEPR